MKKQFIIWMIILSLSITVSVFVHEIGHGISASNQNIAVSTGFNKVGDIYKKPSDSDFRLMVEERKDHIRWDIGLFITLVMAIIFTSSYLTLSSTPFRRFCPIKFFIKAHSYGKLLSILTNTW